MMPEAHRRQLSPGRRAHRDQPLAREEAINRAWMSVDRRSDWRRPESVLSAGPRAPGPQQRIWFQARPETPWRGWAEAVTTLNTLWQRRDDFEVVLFGCDDEALVTGGRPLGSHITMRGRSPAAPRWLLSIQLRSALRPFALPGVRPSRVGGDGVRYPDRAAGEGRADRGRRTRRQYAARVGNWRTGEGD